MSGEEPQLHGFDGLFRAKQWLEATTRVRDSWTVKDTGLKELLAFSWPGGGTFSFDLGGRLRGDSFDGQMFLAEVKKYRNESDLPSHWRRFLAECYVALEQRPDRCDHFMWISWAPFQARRWDAHASAATIRDALRHDDNRTRVFGTENVAEIETMIDEQRILQVSDRIWMLTLSERQEELVIAREHLAEIVKLMIMQRAS